MRVLQVSPYYVPAYSYGGPVKNAHAISTGLVKAGHVVTVVTTDVFDATSRNSVKRETIDGVDVLRFRNISNWAAKHLNAYTPIGFYNWARHNIAKFDVIHCHDFFTWQNVVVSYFAKLHNVPYIVQPRGAVSPVRTQHQRSFVKKLFLTLFSSVLQNATVVAATSEIEQADIIALGVPAERVPVIYNGIDSGEATGVIPVDLHAELDIAPTTPIIGYLGRIQAIKGIDVTLQALARLKQLGSTFAYVIIGPDEQGERLRLEQLASELGIAKEVHFVGMKTGKDKLATLAGCDVFVCTSLSEGTPMTAIEAAMLGLPQVLSTACPIANVFEPVGAAFQHDVTQIDAIADSIGKLLANSDLREAMGQAGQRVVEQQLTLDAVVVAFEELYTSVVASRT